MTPHYGVRVMYKIIQTNIPSIYIYHIACRIDYAYTPVQVVDVVSKSSYKHVRVQRVR